jgi:flagellar basal body P-ring formation protein FlgA
MMNRFADHRRQTVRTSFSFLLLIAAMLGGNAVQAQAPAQQKFENLDRLDGIVAMTVGANMGQPGGPVSPIDRRLHLAACPQTPSVEGPVFGAAVVKCDAIGWRIRVPLIAGGPNMPAPRTASRMAAAPALKEAVVKRGDPVQLVAGGGAFSISRAMVADEDGAMGEMIRVREDKKSPPVIAQVMEIGVVRVPGFKEY